MKLFSKIILYVIAICVLSWFLPWLYALCFPSASSDPFCAFSPVSNKWIATRAFPGQKPEIVELDSMLADGTLVGTNITREERDSLIPQLYYKELLAHDNLPDSINGLEVSVHSLRTHEAMFNQSPREVNKRNAGVWLMMESMPERVDLSDADQVFRFPAKGGIEFVDMATNSVNANRSRRFTEAMTRQGFSFPAVELSANVTSRKQYDEGYLMIDSEGKLFHVKQQAGRPYVARIEMPQGKKAANVRIMEDNNRDLMGFIVDTDGQAYFLEREGYAVMPLPIGNVDLTKQNVVMIGNLFNTTFRINDNGDMRWMAVERTPEGYRLLGNLERPAIRSTSAVVADYIFPYTLSFVSASDSLAYPRVGRFSFDAIWLNILLAVVLFVVNRRRNVKCVAPAILTLFLGVYSFFAFLLIHD